MIARPGADGGASVVLRVRIIRFCTLSPENPVAMASMLFDPIFSGTVAGVTVSNRGLASFSAMGASAFYQIDLLTGASTFVDVFQDAVVDVAVPLATE